MRTRSIVLNAYLVFPPRCVTSISNSLLTHNEFGILITPNFLSSCGCWYLWRVPSYQTRYPSKKLHIQFPGSLIPTLQHHFPQALTLWGAFFTFLFCSLTCTASGQDFIMSHPEFCNKFQSGLPVSGLSPLQSIFYPVTRYSPQIQEKMCIMEHWITSAEESWFMVLVPLTLSWITYLFLNSVYKCQGTWKLYLSLGSYCKSLHRYISKPRKFQPKTTW